MSKSFILIMLLLFFLVAVAYYVGTTSVGLAGTKGAQQLIYAITGRNSTGGFAGYPSGGGTAPTVSF